MQEQPILPDKNSQTSGKTVINGQIDSLAPDSLESGSTQVIDQGKEAAIAISKQTKQSKLVTVTQFSRQQALIISAMITVVVMAVSALTILFLTKNSDKQAASRANEVAVQTANLADKTSSAVPQELQGKKDALLVNGDIIGRGTIQVSNSSYVSVIKTENLQTNQSITLPNASGTVCLDSNNCNYIKNGQLDPQLRALQSGLASTQAGLAAANNNITNLQNTVGSIQARLGQLAAAIPANIVSTLNGQAGAVSIQGSVNRVNVVTNNGVITLSTPQDLDANANVQFGSLTLTAAGTIKANNITQTASGNNINLNAGNDAIVFTANGKSFVLPTGGGISQTICTDGVPCGTSGTTVLLGPATAQVDSTANASIYINDTAGGNLIQLQSSGVDRLTVANNGNTTVASNLTVGGSVTVSSLGTGPLRVTSGVLSVGAINLASSDVTGVLPITNGGTGLAITPTNGQLLIGNGTGYSVATLTNVDGTVDITNGSGSITISVPRADQCSTCADYTLSNLADIIAINKSLLPAGAGLINLGGPTLPYKYLYLSGDSVTPGSNYFTVTGTSSGGARTITLPDASGTVCLDIGNCGGGPSAVTGSSAGTNGYLPMYTGSYTIANSIVSQALGALSIAGDLNVSGNQTISGGLTVTNNISAASFNNLMLAALADGFSITGGTTPRTLTIQGSNITINQSLATTSSPIFNGLTLSNALGVAYGGTGILGGPTADGQLLIGSSGGTYSRSTLTAGSGIQITNNAGSITIAAPTAGTCTVGCADQSLSNLSAVNINTSLLPNSGNSVSLGSTARPFQGLHINSTSGAQGFFLTGTNAGSEVTITLPTLNGTVALVQTAGSSSPQAGDLNINGNIIGSRIQSNLVGSADSTASSNVTVRSGNASAGNSGNLTLDAGTASGTTGSVFIASTNASGLTLGRAGLQVSIPGGLDTVGSDILTSNGNLNTGTGTITSGNINGQTISSSANFTGTVTIQGTNALTLGGAGSTTGAVIFNNLNGANSITLKASDTDPGTPITFTLPNALPGSTECVTLDATGQLGSQNCTGGLTGTGTDNQLPIFTAGGTALTDSIIAQSSNTITIQGASSNLVVAGGTVGGVGNNSISIGTASSRTGGIDFYNESNANTASLVSGTTTASYSLILPTALDTTGKCLNVGAGGQIGYFSCISSGGGGGGSGVTANSGTTDYVVRWTDGTNFVIGDSSIRDNGSRVGIGVAPDATAVLTVGSGAAFKVTNAGALNVAGITNTSGGISNGNGGISSTGAISGATTVAASGLISTSANNQALTVSGAPTNSATQSLVQIGNAISGGNAVANGGTYIGLNAPNAGAGSAADLINLQKNNTSVFKVANTGAVTAGTYNNLSLQSNATGFQVSGGTASRTLTVTSNATIDQNLQTGSAVSFGSLSLTTSALGVASGGTGIQGGPTADGQLLIGSSGGTYTRATLTAGSGINISNAAGAITISAPGSGTCASCADQQLSNLSGTTAIPVDLLASTAGTIKLGSSTVPFNSLYVGTNGNGFRLTGTATAAQTVSLFDAGGPSEICVKYNAGASSNCAGSGGGVTGAGTSGTLPLFNGTQSITDSIVTQSGTSSIAIAGGLGATTGSFSSTLSVTNNISGGSFNNLSLTAAADGFTINGGTTPRTLTVQGANVSLNQSLLTTSNVNFNNVTAAGALSISGASTLTGAVTASSIAPPAATALTLGATGASQSTTLQGNTISFTNGSHTYTFNSSAVGTHTICDNSGNCAGSGGGVTVSAPTTTYKLARFSGSQTITDSIFSEDIGATTGTVAGNFSIQGTTLSGTGALTVASTGGANSLTLNSGSGTITLGATTFQRTAVGGVTFDLSDVNPTTFTVTNSNGTGVANLSVEGSGTFGAGLTSTGGTVNLNASSNNATNINTGSSTGAVSIGNSSTSSLTIESGTGSTSLFNGATAHTVNVATGAAVQTITIGSINTTSLTKIQGGATGSVSIGAVLSETNSSTVNIANTSNATGTQSVTIGSTANAANALTLQSGSTNGVIARADGTAAFRVQNAAGTTTILTADVTNKRINLSDGNAATANLLVLDVSSSAPTAVLGGIYFDSGTSSFKCSTDGSTFTNSCFGTGSTHSKKVVLTAEYTGAVLDADTTNNIGSMISGFDATQRESYYMWSTTQASNQDYDIVVQIPLPSDFSSFNGSTPITIDRYTSNTTNGTITAQLKDTAGANATNWNTCNLTPGSASTWTTTAGCTVTGGTFAADGIMTLRLHIQSPQNGDVRVGNITINYTSAY